MERDAAILRNRLEVLDQRKVELFREIADTEKRMTALSSSYDARISANRARVNFDLSFGQHALAKSQPKNYKAINRAAFRESFVVALGFTLVMGLLFVFAK